METMAGKCIPTTLVDCSRVRCADARTCSWCCTHRSEARSNHPWPFHIVARGVHVVSCRAGSGQIRGAVCMFRCTQQQAPNSARRWAQSLDDCRAVSFSSTQSVAVTSHSQWQTTRCELRRAIVRSGQMGHHGQLPFRNERQLSFVETRDAYGQPILPARGN